MNVIPLKKAKIKQKSITSFLGGKKESLQSIVSQHAAALDDFSIHAMSKSKFFRESIGAKLETFVVYGIVV